MGALHGMNPAATPSPSSIVMKISYNPRSALGKSGTGMIYPGDRPIMIFPVRE
jgi:hypothetical protein